MTAEEQRVYDRLDLLGVRYERYEHPPAATVEDAAQYWSAIDATHCKNLFLRNQKDDRHYLLIVHHAKRVNLRAVANQIGDGKLSFASERPMMSYLGVRPGSVSPFGLIHDGAKHVRVYIDRDLRTAERISFHPNINTVTLSLDFRDFERFLTDCGNLVSYVDVGDTFDERAR